MPPGVTPVVADCDQPEAIGPLAAAADAIVHVAGITAWRGLASAPELDRPAAVLIVSSAGVYSRHRSSAAAYRLGEERLRGRRPDAVIVRPTMIYGSSRDRNVHHVIAAARRYGMLPMIGSGEALIQPIHYRDLSAAICALVGRTSPLAVDAGGGSALTLRAAAEAVFAALGRPVRLVRVPAAAALTAARAIDAVRGSRWAERILRMSEDRSVDTGPLVAMTGVTPRDFPEGVRQQAREMYPELAS